MGLVITEPRVDIGYEGGFSEYDLFKREEFGNQLFNLMKNSDESIVIALDAPWGEGKSTFIKMWASNNNYKQTPPLSTIYFDAFANDYQKDPFLALASELYGLLEENEKKVFIEKASRAGKSLIRSALNIATPLLTGGALQGSVIEEAIRDGAEAITKPIENIITSKLSNAKEDKKALEEFKEFLSKIALEHTEGGKIIFIIDELDRCRPDFALDLLENIKHLFSVPGINFLLVINRRQLEEIIKCRYGNGIDATTYLQKFITLGLILPKKNGIKGDGLTYFDNLVKPQKVTQSTAANTLKALIEHRSPSLREIEKILTYFMLFETIQHKRLHDSHQEILACVCFLFVLNFDLLKDLVSKEKNTQELLAYLNVASHSKELDGLVELLDDSEPREQATNEEIEIKRTKGIHVFSSCYNVLKNLQITV